MSRRSSAAAYRVPAVLAVGSLVGLVAALIGDGVMDWVSWLLLGGLLGVTVWSLARRRMPAKESTKRR
jgi:xanthosine utilization system XapX-like protein